MFVGMKVRLKCDSRYHGIITSSTFNPQRDMFYHAVDLQAGTSLWWDDELEAM